MSIKKHNVASDSENSPESVRVIEYKKIYWARVSGFPPWPGRLCSEPEERQLAKKTKITKTRPTHYAILFLGISLEKAWILESSLQEFDEESFIEKFQAKRFQDDRDYRAAIVEAFRLQIANGIIFSEDVLKLVNHPESDIVWSREDVCTVCKGTELSGKSLICDNCDQRETHFHCLRVPVTVEPKGQWFCDFCCKANGIKPGMILPVKASQSDDGEDVETTKKRKKRPYSTSKIVSAINPLESNTSTTVIATQQSQLNPEKKQKLSNESTSSGNKSNGVKSKIINKQLANEAYYEDITAIQTNQTNANQRLDEYRQEKDKQKIEDEKCFVCNGGGNVIICDFPDCSRVYHSVCIFSTLPSTLSMPGQDANVSDMDGDTWYCPKHFCVKCSAIESAGSIMTVPTLIPTNPAANLSMTEASETEGDSDSSQNNDSSASANIINAPQCFPSYRLLPRYLHGLASKLMSKPLRSCASCPFSICADCEQDILNDASATSGSAPLVVTANRSYVFRCRRGFGRVMDCLNCVSSTNSIQLAKVFEKAWIRLAGSRLSVPFLRPLLPVLSCDEDAPCDVNLSVSDDKNAHTVSPVSVCQSETMDQSNDPLARQPFDMISILEKIRALKYLSINQFLDDLYVLRDRIIRRLCLLVDVQYDQEKNKFVSLNKNSIASSSDSPDASSMTVTSISIATTILSAYDTVQESCRNYLMKDGGLIIDTLTKKLKECGLQSNRVNGDSSSASETCKSVSNHISALMTSIWRKECNKSIVNAYYEGELKYLIDHVPTSSSSVCASSEQQLQIQSIRSKIQHYSIIGRDLERWSEFIAQGAMSDKFKGAIDPWGIWNPCRDESKLGGSVGKPSTVSQYITQESTHSRYKESDLNTFFSRIREEAMERNAVESMLQLNGQYDRETVTLLEDHHADISTPWITDDSCDDAKLLEDETALVLQRLQDLTTKSLHLQVRLKRAYDKSQEQLYDRTVGGFVSFGESQAIQKLKIMNRELQWQLEQRNRSIVSNKSIIDELLTRLSLSEERVQVLTKENERLVDRIQELSSLP